MTETCSSGFFAVLTGCSPRRLVLRRNPVHAAVSLVGAFLLPSGILRAPRPPTSSPSSR